MMPRLPSLSRHAADPRRNDPHVLSPLRHSARATLVIVAAASFGAAGCSDPVPPIPEGGWSVAFQNPGGGDCNVNSHNEAVGTVTADQKSALIQDGTDASVSCNVSASSVSGSVFQNVKNLDIQVSSISSDATVDNPATGLVSFTSPTTVNSFVSSADAPCIFYFGEGQGIQDGEVWLTFSCPDMVSEGQSCRIQQGYAAFKNCE